MSASLVELSTLETRLFGIRMGRANLSDLDPDFFMKELLEHRFDVVRLSLPADDPHIGSKLKQLGLPCFLSGLVHRFWISCDTYDLKTMANSGVRFEPYTSQYRSQIKETIETCFGDQASGFYEVPYFKSMVSLDTQAESVSHFFIEQIENDLETYKAWVILADEQFAGFLINTLSPTTTETVLAGIKPEFRNQKIFKNITRFSQNFGKATGRVGGYTGARIQNILSQKLFTDEGMTYEPARIVYFVTPFLSTQVDAENFHLCETHDDPLSDLSKYLSTHLENLKIRSLRFRRYRDTPCVRFSYQALASEKSKFLGIAGFLDKSNTLCGSAWIDLDQVESPVDGTEHD